MGFGRLVHRISPAAYTKLSKARQARSMLRSPGLIAEAMRLSRVSKTYFNGWSTPHATRWWEYAWAMQQVDVSGPLAKRALEVGAGTSPTPIALRQRGFEVVVIDPDAETLLGRKVGNEWDYTDYGAWGITTVRAGMEEYESANPFGVIMSISVIEHVPAAARREGFRRFGQMLTEGGLCVLTIDLIPGTNRLWNRVEDEIEPTAKHGDLDEVIEELAAVGLNLITLERCPIVAPPTDVVGMVLQKSQSAGLQ